MSLSSAKAKGAVSVSSLSLSAWLCLFGCAGSAAGDVVRLLDGDADSLRARFELIAGAEHTLQAAYYLIDVDPVTYAVLACLRDAARRGVRVQILVDAYRDRMPPPIRSCLLREGIEIRQYHPMQWERLSRCVYRLHDKLLLKDGEVMVVGGRNVSAKYFGESSGDNFRDCDVLVAGGAAREAAAYFRRLWNSEHVQPAPAWRPPTQLQAYYYPSLCRRRRLSKAAELNELSESAPRILDAARQSALARSPAPLPAEAPLPLDNLQITTVRFLQSSRFQPPSTRDITDDLLEIIRSAQHSIDIETPYLILSDRFLDAIRSALGRGVPVRILTNSLASTNQIFAHAGYANQRAQLIEMGVELWEYQGSGHLHAKCLAADDWAVVGSYNLHPRSQYYDSEVAVAIRDAQFAATLRASMGGRRAGASLAGRPPGPLSDPSPPQRKASSSRYAVMQALRLVAPLVNRQL